MKLFNHSNTKKGLTLSVFGINRFQDWVIIFIIFIFLLIGIFSYSYVLYQKIEGDIDNKTQSEDVLEESVISEEELNKILNPEATVRSANSPLYIDPFRSH